MEVDNFLKVLDHYNVTYKDYGEAYRMCCPLHEGKNPTSFALKKENALWFCHADCNTGGDLLSFVMKKEDISFHDAVTLVSNILDINVTDIQTKQGVGIVNQNTQKFLKFIESMNNTFSDYELPNGDYYDLNRYRDFNKSTLEHFKMKYAKQFKYVNREGKVVVMKNRLVFPLYSEEKLVGVSIRRVNNKDFPKWMHLPQGIQTGNLLYNLDNIVPFEPIIVVEGTLDVWKWYELGFENVVATLGSNLSHEQEMLLLKHTDTVYLCYDGDKPGKDASEKIHNQLKYKFNLFNIDLPDEKDPCDLTDEELMQHYQNRRRII